MSKKIYVGNVPWRTTESELKGLFEEFGDVLSISMIMDHESGRYRGFSFIEMESDSAANEAIKALDDYSLDGRTLRVNEARERERSSERDDRGRGSSRDHDPDSSRRW